MSVIIQLQNLPLSASSLDIRNFFGGLNIPPGGVHIVGGKKGAAFIAFANDEDARQAMEKNGRRIKDARIKLALSSHRELKDVLEELHKEQSEYEMSRKVRLSDSKQERSRSHLKYRRSRSRSQERNRSHPEYSPNSHKNRGKYDDRSQRENLFVKQQRPPYDRLTERKVLYSESYNQEPLMSAHGIDKPNPYISSACGDHSDDERNDEIRRHIESFIAAFGQAENYRSFDTKKDVYPSHTFKTGHDSYSSNSPQPGLKDGVQHNRFQTYSSSQMPMENYPPKIFDDFDSRRHYDQQITDNNANMSEAPGHADSNMSGPYNPFKGQEDRTLRNVDGDNFSGQGKTDHNFSQDRLLNSPMDIEEDKTVNDNDKLQPNPHFGPQVFSALEEMSKVHGENVPVPVGSSVFNVNVPPPFHSFENRSGDLRLNTSGKNPCAPEDAKDLCIKLEGLPYFATDNDIRRIFQGASIFDMFIQYTSDGKATGIGFVQFSSAEGLQGAVKMKYGMIGEYRVEFRGSSRAELMEARMPSSSAVADPEPNASYKDVLALKRTQDILSSMMSAPEPRVPTTYPTVATSYPVNSSYPAVPTSNQQAGKRSLCAVITGFPSHFTRHIQVLKCIEDIGINFHLIHLVLNNRARFTGKVFAEFHDLLDLDAALKKHNQSVEGCTIGVKQVLYEEMGKFLDSHRSRCMYPTPKQPDYLEKKPEKAPYIWEPPYEAVDKRTESDYRRGRDTPAVWSSDRAMEDQRRVLGNGFYSQMNERDFLENPSRIEPFNVNFGFSGHPELYPGISGASHHNMEINRFQFPNIEVYDRVNPADTGNLYSDINTANDTFQAATDFFHGNSEMSVPDRRSRDGQFSPKSKEVRGLTSRKNDPSTSYSREREPGYSPARRRLKREDSPKDSKYKRFKNERNRENIEVRFSGSRTSPNRQIYNQEKKQSFSSQNGKGERKDEELKRYSAGLTTTKSKAIVNSPARRNVTRIKEGREAGNTSVKKSSGGQASSQKDVVKVMEHSPKTKLETEKVPGKASSSDNIIVSKHQKKRFEHRKNCPKRQKSQHVESESRSDDHSRHRSDRRELRKDYHDVVKPEDLFSRPGYVLEATNVDPHIGLYEIMDFFRGYDLQSENLIRRYTDTGEPTSDLRIAFHCQADAEQAYKILNRQYLKGRPVMLSFV